MNDRVVALLDNYEFTVLRTWKGRGAIIFETSDGLKILREYQKAKEKLTTLDQLLTRIAESDLPCRVDRYAKTKEGEYYVTNRDEQVYVVKDYYEGRECSVRVPEDVLAVAGMLAKLHKVMRGNFPESSTKESFTKESFTKESSVKELSTKEPLETFRISTLQEEMERHNRELNKIYKFLRKRGQKSEFELFLLHHYLTYLDQAKEVASIAGEIDFTPLYDTVRSEGIFCHGEYQYHNVYFLEQEMAVLNFEKASRDVQIRDFTYFMRKVMEKNNWSVELGCNLLEAYDRQRTITELEKKQLYYRLLYPEKFWKIVNFYYNNTKSWIPMRNQEKLEQFMAQEQAKKEFLARCF